MKREDCKKCPESICESGIYHKRIDPKTGNIISYKRGNILKTKEVSVRPICLLGDHFRVDPTIKVNSKNPFLPNHFILIEAVTYIIDNLDLSLETILYYMKIKNEIICKN